MLAATKHMLKEFYAPYNNMLAKLPNDQGYLWDDVLD